MNQANIPSTEFHNLFLEDQTVQTLWEHWIGNERFSKLRNHFEELGKSAALATPLSVRADKEPPTLLTHNSAGDRVDTVVQHPDYHDLEALSYGKGILSIKYDSGFLAENRDIRHLVGFAGGYLFGQTEPSLFCPICMTDGVGRVLERHAPNQPLARETLAHLSTTRMDQLWQGAMFLTERQGGSDVGANTARARKQGDRWFLDGDKWFCSNVAADAILALARMPEGPVGTQGLGLFLVLRQRPSGNSRTIRIHRLKDKMGVRSMPTGEVTFENTEATLIGGIGEGFKQMAEMLNLSRMYNSVASIATMRRAILEAYAYGSQRKAFGSALSELPLWRMTLADLTAEHLGALLLVFETVRALDRSDLGDDAARRLCRLTIPMAKALTGKLGVFIVSESMEAIGGNAYIEESIMPRLLRDTQVLPIWEGCTNILTLDVIRAIRKENSHEAFFSRIRQALQAAPQGANAELVKKRAHNDQVELQRLTKLPDELQQRGARQWIERAGRTFELALLLEASALPQLKEIAMAAFERLAVRPFGIMPVGQGEQDQLIHSEEVLLKSIWNLAGDAGGI